MELRADILQRRTNALIVTAIQAGHLTHVTNLEIYLQGGDEYSHLRSLLGAFKTYGGKLDVLNLVGTAPADLMT